MENIDEFIIYLFFHCDLFLDTYSKILKTPKWKMVSSLQPEIRVTYSNHYDQTISMVAIFVASTLPRYHATFPKLCLCYFLLIIENSSANCMQKTIFDFYSLLDKRFTK